MQSKKILKKEKIHKNQPPTPVRDVKGKEEKKNLEDFFKMYYGYILIAMIGFLLYCQTISYRYVDFDDKGYIIENAHYFEDFSNIYKGFAHSVSLEYYRPLLFSSFIFDYSIAKTDPFIYHLSNILFHLISCLLLFRLLCLLEYNRWISFWTTLIFTVHPLFVQAIAWIFGRNDPYLAIFILSGMISYINYQKTKKITYLFLHLFWYTACLFTKESGVGLAMVCFAYSVLKIQKDNAGSIKKSVSKFILLWGLITLIWIPIRHKVLKETAAKFHGTKIAETEISINAFIYNIPFTFESLSKLILPLNQSIYPAYSWLTSLIGVSMYFLLLVLLLYIKPRSNIILWTMGWWFIFLLPPTIIRATDMNFSDYLEHRIYLPAIGFIIFLNELLHKNKSFFGVEIKEEIFIPSKWIFLPVVFIFGSITYHHSKNFEDGITFWKSATETSPNSPAAWRARGKWFFDLGELDTAEMYLKEAFRLNPAEKVTMESLGRAFELKNKFDGALRCYKRILQENPNNGDYMVNVGRMYVQKNNYDSALSVFEKAIQTNPNHYRAYFEIGILAEILNDIGNAKTYFQKASELNPQLWQAHFNLARMLERQSLFEEAKKEYEKTSTLNPQMYEAKFQLGLMHFQTSQYENAKKSFLSAVQLDPQKINAYIYIAHILYLEKKYEESKNFWGKAVSLNPQIVKSYVETIHQKEEIILFLKQNQIYL